MAYANTYQSHSAAAFVDEDSAVLDPTILDPDMHSPTGTSFRKDSFANTHGVLSPADSQAWDHQYSGPIAVESTAPGAPGPFHDDAAVFVRQQPLHPPPAFAQQHQPGPWPFEHGSGDCTPTTGAEFMPPPPPFEGGSHYVHNRADSAHGSFSHHPPHQQFPQHAEAHFIPAPQVQTPMSPHSHQDWMGMAQQEMEGRPSSKRMRPSSPPRTMIDFQRRDGIRKKNGRIDIPHERNIQTIDELIEQTTDEDTLKELKQQKRLLRNREAALASRQRKKKHTEDLEVKEKSYTTQIAMLEAQLGEFTRERDVRERERQVMHQRLAESQRIIDTMQDEKRELMMRHNEEASQLRRRVQILTEQLEIGPAPAMSAAPSSTGFTDFNAEMEALNMGTHDWDNFIFVNDLSNNASDDFSFGAKHEPSKKTSVPSNAVQSTSKRSTEAVTDQPIASGLLFMLLLCGAWIASKPPASQPHDLPQMPPDVRAAAPAVLDSLLAESGVPHGENRYQSTTEAAPEPLPSGQPAPGRSSKIDRMHHAITTSTKQQQIDQAFSLTQAQYASLTNGNGHAYNQPMNQESGPPQRRVLAEALANLEQDQPGSNKAEVYTRSLLWGQIPSDVVRQFKELVREHNEIDRRGSNGNNLKTDTS
ncbi:hypothetical protein CB0940_01196 [Cercospora beticola]|uniref:BZIP domain-containing protein n=1 Tax=Cercospora beticola TaxID=122368 RepID=A0A2G5IAR1_CERBT|nr:hypothetical protein CB0940_01196 [Cercospora beticola]PIB01888.1 hypothetical protein CB0940_01196 [Cercospora beticola]WPA96626.1 hypothetical protein RHO25_001233 [Cercospora beticola]CAK1355032.1 unnamed protein product [Cercospora beticola]